MVLATLPWMSEVLAHSGLPVAKRDLSYRCSRGHDSSQAIYDYFEVYAIDQLCPSGCPFASHTLELVLQKALQACPVLARPAHISVS